MSLYPNVTLKKKHTNKNLASVFQKDEKGKNWVKLIILFLLLVSCPLRLLEMINVVVTQKMVLNPRMNILKQIYTFDPFIQFSFFLSQILHLLCFLHFWSKEQAILRCHTSKHLKTKRIIQTKHQYNKTKKMEQRILTVVEVLCET